MSSSTVEHTLRYPPGYGSFPGTPPPAGDQQRNISAAWFIFSADYRYHYRLTERIMNEINEVVVSGVQIADLFEISEPRVRQLAQLGVLVREGRGKFKLAESVRRYIAHRQAELAAPEAQRREQRSQREHDRWLQETALAEGALVPSSRISTLIEGISRAREKAVQATDRELINVLWPRGVKDIDLVKTATAAIDKAFCGWLNAAIWACEQGADEQTLKFIFNSMDTAPKPPFELPSARATARRKKKAAESEA